MVFRRLEPNCEKSHVRPSLPAKSAWHDVHASDAPSRAVLTTWPWTCEASWASRLYGGIGACTPAASRADVLNRILPSCSDGASGSTARLGTTARTNGMHSAPPQLARVVHAVAGAPRQAKPAGVAATIATLRAR